MTHEVSTDIVIDVPISEAWQKLKDLSAAHNYVPGIVRSVIVTEQTEGVGASRYVYRNSNSYIQETVDEWQDGTGFRIYLHKGDKPAPPFKNAWFRYALTKQDANRTGFTATLTYDMPWGAVGNWLGAKMKNFAGRSIADVALAMKLYYETGKPTSAKALKVYKSGLRLSPDN